MPFPPATLKILSDNNELKYLETIKPNGKGELQYIFQYTKSKSKKGMLLELTQLEL